MANKKALDENVSSSSNVYATMSYIGVLCLVPLILNKKDEFVNFHARQGLVIWIWEALAMFCLFVPVLGRFIFSFSAVVCLVLSAAGLVSVSLGKSWKLPVIGQFAEKL